MMHKLETEFSGRGVRFPDAIETRDSHSLFINWAGRWVMGFLLLGCSNITLAGNYHRLQLLVEALEGGLYAYRMVHHEIVSEDGTSTDITNRYVTDRGTIPGPTIVLDEGDIAEIELLHRFEPDSPFQEHVSLHVHGVHYDLDSDGTLKYINLYKDQSATPYLSYVYRWDAAPGTAGTWPYHDHNMESHNGAEDKGLFGALIVHPASGTERVRTSGTRSHIPLDGISKDYVFYIGDDAFWGMEIDNATGQQTALGINPALTAQRNTQVRFHLIALGTNFHQFELPTYRWPDPGTRDRINQKIIGSLEKHVFTVKATHSTRYLDSAFTGRVLGMQGDFIVTD